MPNRPSIVHYTWFSDLQAVQSGQVIHLQGPEAHHAARVKRVRVDQTVGVLDGKGRVGKGVIRAISGSKSSPTIEIEIHTIDVFEPTTPNVEIWGALPKGDHLDRMIDQLTQLGVATYRPLLCQRSQRKPQTVRLDKLERIAREATKQCHRPWSLRIDDPISFEQALGDPDVLIADAGGAPLSAAIGESTPKRLVIMIGPEGGWSDAERDMIGATQCRVVRFGVFVLRVETAACAASALVLSSACSLPRKNT